jgi:hypothetical protein
MTVLNTPNDGSYNVLMVLFRALKELGPIEEEQLRAYCSPGLDEQPERLRHTLNRWRALGLFQHKDGKIHLGEDLAFSGDEEASLSELSGLVRPLVFKDANNEAFWDSEKSKCADLTRGLAWLMAQDIYKARLGDTAATQALESEQLVDAERRIIQNGTRFEALRVWGLALGFLWNAEAPVIDPTGAIGEELERIFAGSSELTAAQLQTRIATVFPIMDGGRYRLEMEKALNPATWSAPASQEILSTSLSRALWRLNEEGRLVLSHPSDSGDVRVLQRIRELLFEDGRELVLLIEDFAALSGIQETLLSVCIQEAVRDGRLVRAPMRTAIAITDGYLKGRDTILTRAKRVWQVRTTLNAPEDVFAATTALVAAYLNAARWGSAELERQFRTSARPGALSGWITPFADENLSSIDADTLNAFGYGPKNVPLFPYNEAAIRNLARRHLSEGGQILFKPRAIINFILRDLLEHRDLFLRGAFPPDKFEGAAARAEVASWLGRAPVDSRGRLESVIVYWGDNPAALGALTQLPQPMFEAFKVPTPRSLGYTPSAAPATTPPRATIPKSTPPGKTPPPPQHSEDPERKRWSDLLEAWATSGRVLQPQRDANYSRKAVSDLLMRSMNWTALRVARSAAPEPFISIHNAAGEGASATYKLPISREPGDPDGRLRKGLLAIIQYEHNGRSWEYPEGDQDGAAAASFISRLAGHYAEDVEAQALQEIAWLADLLVIQARVLGIPFRESSRPERIAEVALSRAEAIFVDGLPQDEERWQQLQQAAVRLRPELQRMLLARLGCFQGTGSTPYGIDVLRFSQALKSTEKKPPRECTQGDLGAHAGHLKDAFLRVRVQPVVQRLRDFVDEIASAFGPSFNKEEYLREAKELVDSVGPSVWPPLAERRPALLAAVEEFRMTPLKETLERIGRLPEGDLVSVTVQELVSVASHIDFSAVLRTREFIGRMTRFVGAVEQEVAAKERTAEDADPITQAAAIDEALKKIAEALESVAGTV